MQLRFHPRNNRKALYPKVIVRIILGVLVFFLLIFLADKIDMPTPTKFIKQEISNEKIITLK
jgi:hypothetical protein